MCDSNLDILSVLGPISMKIGMYCRETLFQHIPAYVLNLKVKLSRKYKNKSVGVRKVVRYRRNLAQKCALVYMIKGSCQYDYDIK